MIEYDPTRPKWQQIADELRKQIESGELAESALISEVKLEREFGVARTTIRKATAKLRDEKLIITTPGMGSFVAPRTEQE
ncbi:GntR family transcriptional regulator [Streptomyces sp. 1331.2]|uniref:GntR family transcriptional regulator n=1 Tax=Streptomyces sp. 1331.2 TaxID=1938835 RepID=UPI000BE46790|nr:GntR family transcriptional regulator [Streptomyces sp. 1331.2]